MHKVSLQSFNRHCSDKIRELVREVWASNYVEIISGSLSPNHIHLLISVPPSLTLSKLVQYIKGRSSRKILQEFEILRKRYWEQHFGRGIILQL